MQREFLTKEILKEKVPSIFSTTPSESVSNRYSFINSEKVVDNFAKLGWYPTQAKTCVAYKEPKNAQYEKHLIRFAQKNNIEVNEVIPEIVMFNSHNRSVAFRLTMGLFRLVCSNGMVIAKNMFIDLSQKHINVNFDQIQETTIRATKEFETLANKIDDYKKIGLTPHQSNEFALVARNKHWGDNSIIEPYRLLEAKRPEDEQDNLWTIFNVIQENIMKGGISYQGRNAEGKVRQRRTREITNVVRDVNINVFLWGLMENFRLHQRF